MCRYEIARDIIKKCRLGRCDAAFGDDVCVGGGKRLGGERHGPNVPDVVESIAEAGTCKNPCRMVPAAIGEDKALAGQRREDGIQRPIWLKDREVDVVHIGQEIFRVDIV